MNVEQRSDSETRVSTVHDKRVRIATWVATQVLPHEVKVRSVLARSRIGRDEIDEIIQETYCRLAMLDTVDHIEAPAAYFMSVARNLLIRKLKRNRIISIEAVAELESYQDDAPSPEQAVTSHSDYARMMAILAALPDRCRRIVQLRKIEGWSQKQIAEHLGTTEKAVEKQVWLGVKTIREKFRLETDQSPSENRKGRAARRQP